MDGDGFLWMTGDQKRRNAQGASIGVNVDMIAADHAEPLSSGRTELRRVLPRQRRDGIRQLLQPSVIAECAVVHARMRAKRDVHSGPLGCFVLDRFREGRPRHLSRVRGPFEESAPERRSPTIFERGTAAAPAAAAPGLAQQIVCANIRLAEQRRD